MTWQEKIIQGLKDGKLTVEQAREFTAKYRAAEKDPRTQPEEPEEEISKLQSGLSGAAQELSLGFGDEIAGGVSAAYDKITGDDRDISEIYEENRNKVREYFKSAEEQNPGSYLTGQLGGGAASLLIPGGALSKAAKLAGATGKTATAAKVLSAPVAGAVYGGAAGAGHAESDTVGAALSGAALGAAIPAGLGAAGKVLKGGGTMLGTTLTGVPGDIIKRYASNPSKVEKYITKFDGDEAEAANALRKKWNNVIKTEKTTLGNKIGQILKEQGAGGKQVDDVINSLKEKIKTLSPVAEKTEIRQVKKMIKELESQKLVTLNRELGKIAQRHNIPMGVIAAMGLKKDLTKGIKLPPKDLQAFKKKWQKIANYKPTDGSSLNPGMQSKQRMAAHAGKLIKKKVEEIAPGIKPVNKKFGEISALSKKTPKNLITEDKAYSQISGAGSGKNKTNASILRQWDDLTGGKGQFSEGAKDFATFKAFNVGLSDGLKPSLGLRGILRYGVPLTKPVRTPIKGIQNNPYALNSILQSYIQGDEK